MKTSRGGMGKGGMKTSRGGMGSIGQAWGELEIMKTSTLPLLDMH